MKTKAESIKARLKGLKSLPCPVHDWEIEMGPDATNDPAVWVWAILEDEQVDIKTLSKLRDLVAMTVDKCFSEPAPWVYVRFRDVAELTHL